MFGIIRSVAILTVSVVAAHYVIQAINTELAKRPA